MDRKTQAAVAAAIFGVISLLMLAAASMAIYACTQPSVAPAMPLVAGFFMLFSIGAGAAAYSAATSRRTA